VKSFKDQLKDAKKKLPVAEKPEKKPLPKTIPREPEKSDEELFRDAVAGVSRDAVLAKYDANPPPPEKPKSASEAKADDDALFAKFVGDVDKKSR
jgi:hypothetical protein